MKVFSCSDMGGTCEAKIMAPTEDRLAEEVSIHLREVHGMSEIPQDMLGRIKRLFVNKATKDAASVVDRILEKYNCDSDPECSWRYIAESEMILTGSEGVHSRELKAA